MADERLRIVASLIRTTRDWDLAEDAVADAAERALLTWPRDGVPRNPAAWLTTTAQRRALDVIRRAGTERTKLAELGAQQELDEQGEEAAVDHGAVADDRLRLVFTCCHPALVDGGAGRAHAQGGRRPVDRRGGPDVPGRRGDDEPAAAARQEASRERRHPLQGPRGGGPGRAARRRARGGLPGLHAGVRRRGGARARRGGHPPRPAAGGPDARRGRGPRAARADARPARPPRRPARRRRARHPRAPGPVTLGPRGGGRGAEPDHAAREGAGAVPAPGRAGAHPPPRGARGRHRLAPDRPAVRAAARPSTPRR